MRASLASAASLLALLLAEGQNAWAAAIFSTTNSLVAFGDGLVSTAGSGSSVATLTGTSGSTVSSPAPASRFGGSAISGTVLTNSMSYPLSFTFTPLSTGAAIPQTLLLTDSGSGSNSLTLTGTGVAPLETITTSNPYFLVGSSGTISLNVANTGNGNASGHGSISNLRGSVGSASSIFTGTGGAFSLQDTTSTSASASTQSFAYTYTPTPNGAAASSTVMTNFNDGVGSTNSTGAVTTTLTATGVAPVGVLSTRTSNYVLVGQTGTSSITVSNTGDGNPSGLGTISNLRGGGISTSSVSGFSAPTTTAFSLGDSTQTVSNLPFAPTVKGATASAMVVASLSNGGGATNATSATNYSLTGTGVTPFESVTGAAPTTIGVGTTTTSTVTIANTGNGNLSGLGSISNLNGSISTSLGAGITANGGNATSLSLNDAASTTLAYTYAPISRGTVSSTATIVFSSGNAMGSNASQTISSVFVNQAVGPVHASSVSGAGAADTPVAVAKASIGAASSTISFGSLGYNKSATIYLDLQNATADPGGSLTNPSIEQYSISSANAGLAAGSVITGSGHLLVPITVMDANRAGTLNSSLTIFTDESAALGGTGDIFTYSLTALNVPEPASIAVLGAGLAGLAGLRRGRGGRA